MKEQLKSGAKEIPSLENLVSRAIDRYQSQRIHEEVDSDTLEDANFGAAVDASLEVVSEVIEKGISPLDLFSSLLRQTKATPQQMSTFESAPDDSWDDMLFSLAGDIVLVEMSEREGFSWLRAGLIPES